MTAPCYRCQDRTTTCYSDCPRYAAFAAERAQIRKRREEDYKIDAAFAERGDKIRRDASRWAKKARGR